ncbi:21375_t:CDS:2, partial [Entrophospora sp. SA101]
KWCTLPKIVSESHISLLHSFQLMVEFDEATKIFSNLSNYIQSLDNQNEIRNVISSWRERLPNMWDDINIWNVTTHEPTPNKVLADSLHSFKVLTECPIIVVLIFQSHRNVVNGNILNFLPLIIRTLSLQPRPQAEAHESAKARGEIFIGVAPGIRDRVKYTEFIVAQVKTLAFLAYVLRAYTAELSHYQDQVPEFIIRLLHD